MTRHSQTEIAVLGALSVEPMTGYAVRAAITETLGDFWSESFGQIYPTLGRLEAVGHVRRATTGKTSGSKFEITESGLARLRDLLAEPIDVLPPRNGLLLRLFFGHLLGPAVCAQLIGDALDRAEAAASTYAAVRAEILADPHNPHAPYWLITVTAGERAAAAQVEWARDALALLPPEAASARER
ncbi:MAG: PadR family transcriptional regulator [Cellulomonadaceae bacterium]|nr:PadR family transcriptional regulator [Cellulomonadaceae bacterium]